MSELLQPDRLYDLARAAITVVIGLVLARTSSSALGKVLAARTTPQLSMLGKKITFYLILALAVLSGLREAGFELSVLLGAAGVASVALGFASQTSASNLISGLFLLTEQPFRIGETIRIAQTTGEVVSVDLLSVKLRTFDNLFVRVPNETVIKSEITNFSRYPIRRYDLQLSVAYDSDLAQVRRVLLDTAEQNRLCLNEPKPLILFQGFGESSINLQFSVWAARTEFLSLRNSLSEEVKLAFDSAGIEIPFPQRTLTFKSSPQAIAPEHLPSNP